MSEKKDITEIDKNFALKSSDGRPLEWLSADDAPLKVYGVKKNSDGFYSRLPKEMGENVNEGVKQLYTNTSGGRVRFSTNSKYLCIRSTYSGYACHPHMPATGSGGFDLYCDQDEGSVFHRLFIPPTSHSGEYLFNTVKLSGEMRSYTLNMPLYADVKELYLGFEPGAKICEGKEYKVKKPIVFYGSSITQGGCASRPGNAYTAMISNDLDADYINLGFSSAGLAEENMMEYIGGLDMSVFVYDYDHNAPNPEHLEKTHKRGFEIFRKLQPDTPVVFVSMPCWYSTSTKEYDGIGFMRRDIIYSTYIDALKNGDKNVCFVDGRSLFAGKERYACSVDGIHPNDLGMFKMAIGIEDAIEFLWRKL